VHQHGSGRVSVHSRHAIAVRVLEQGWSISEAARQAAVSRQTATKWVARYRAGGQAGLQARSTRPHRIPRRVPERVVRQIELLRRQRLGCHRIA
jgi:transposase